MNTKGNSITSTEKTVLAGLSGLEKISFQLPTSSNSFSFASNLKSFEQIPVLDLFLSGLKRKKIENL